MKGKCTMEKMFKKGDVWFVKEDRRISNVKEELNDRSSRYSRQYLIISNDENLNGEWDNLITCIPISYHKADRRYWSEVVFSDADGYACKALCKEIHTIDRNRFINKTFSIREGQMKFVEKILQSRIMSSSIEDLEEQVRELQEKIEEMKTPRKQYQKWTPERVKEFLHDAACMTVDNCLSKYSLSYKQFLSTRRYCMMKRNSSWKYNI